MEALFHDLRYAFRTLRKSPGFTAVAVLTLALGIGGNSAIFSIVDGVLLRPLPYGEPDQLVSVLSTNLERGPEPFFSSPPDFRELRERNDAFQSIASYYPVVVNLAGDGNPERVNGASVSPGLIPLLGIQPEMGRTFSAEEGRFGNHRVVLLSHGLWSRRFGADPGVIGRSVAVDGESFTVAGIMPPDFRFPDRQADLWMPMAFAPDDPLDTRGNYFLRIVGRLKPNISVAQAQSDLQDFARRIGERYPSSSMTGMRVVPLREQIVGEARAMLLLLLGAVSLVLLVVCANLANLLLARAAARQGEIAVRAGLGASRGRLVRQLLAEILLLGLLGGVSGMAVASWGVSALTAFGPVDLPRLAEIRVDGRMLAFSFALTCLTALLVGLLPSLRASKTNLSHSLRQSIRSSSGAARQSLRESLVAAEIALALVLLLGTGLLLRSLVQVLREDPGFRVENLLTFSIALPSSTYPETDQVWTFFDRLLERARALPGIRSAAVTSGLSLQGGYWSKLATPLDRPLPTTMDAVPVVAYRLVSRGYFRTMGIPLRDGRDFAGADRQGSPGVAVINETMARRFWQDEDPIGRTILLGPPEAILADVLPPGFRFPRLRIVGIVADERFASLDQPPEPELYQLYSQSAERPPAVFVALHGDGDPRALAAAMRTTVRELDPDLPLAQVATMAQLVRGATAERRFSLTLIGIFAALALALAALGIYGVTSYAVIQRRQEIGIRVSLGATRGVVLALVLRQGIRMVLIGLGAGLIAAVALTRLLAGMVYGVSTTDSLTFAAVALLLTAVALLACHVPARRAARVDPMTALRAE